MASEDESRDPTPPQKRRRTAEGSPARYESSDEVGSRQRDTATSKRDGRARPQRHREGEEEEEAGSRDGRSLTRTPSEKADRAKYYSPMDQSSRSHSRGRSASRLQSRSRSRSRVRSRSRYDSRSRSQSRSRSDSRSSSSHKRARSRSGSQSSDRTRSEYYSPRAPNLTPPREQFKPDYRPRFVLHGHTGPVSQVRISPNGRFIASASADATIKIWDASNGSHMDTLVGHMAGVNCVSWSPDSNTLASGSDDKAVRLWDRVTGRPKTTTRKSVAGQKMAPLRGHHNYVHCVAFSPKGNIIASGSYDEAVFLWDVRAGRLMRSLPAHSDPVSGIDFCPDGTLVVSCSTDGLIRIWDTATGQCLRTLVHEDNPAVTNVCFSPNGRFVLAFNLDNCIRLWDYVAGSVKKTYQGHKNEKFAVGGCFAAMNGEAFVASASEDGNIVLWDVKTKNVLQRIEGHKSVCFWVDVHGDAMVSAGQDHTVKVYGNAKSLENGARENGVATIEEGDVGHAKLHDELPIRHEDVKMEGG